MTDNDSATSARPQTSRPNYEHAGRTYCGHEWDGPIARAKSVHGENIVTLTCSNCGAWAVDVLRETA